MSRQILFVVVVVVVVFTLPAAAQLRPVPLEQRIDRADLIVEGRVVASKPFLDPTGPRIYTAHVVEVFKVFQEGRAPGPNGRIELLTPGGRVGETLHLVEPSLRVGVGDTGVFFIERRGDFAGREVAYLPYAGPQGFVKYRARGKAADPFREYDDVANDLLGAIERRLGRNLRVVKPFVEVRDKAAPGGGPIISGFNPTTIRGGVQELLTIDGSGFGTLTGSAAVFLDDPDDGGGGSFSGATSLHIQSWSDTQIQLLVPKAGTGAIIVQDSSGVQAVSPGTLTVEYSLNEIVSGDLYRVHLEEQNGRGGYTFRYSTSTANSGVDISGIPAATARFEDSIVAWNCSTNFNIDVDGTTTEQATGDDGVNIVSFDNSADPLPGGVLGRASSFFVGCAGDSWFLSGVDVRFKRDGTDGVSWYYGADPGGQAGSEADFASVAVHELGHANQLTHINDGADVMYWALTVGQSNRAPSVASTNGGLDIAAFSDGFATCGTTGMLAFDCSAPPTADFVPDVLGVCGTGATIQFTDLSLNGPTSWDWSFGDGSNSPLRNPSHDYTAQGQFDVSLTATNANGSDSATRESLIVITDPPETPFCDPTFAGHNDCCSIGIFNVALNSIDNSTGSPTQGDPLAEDFTCSQFTVLAPGASYPVSVTTGPANLEDVRIHIDWNDNGVLDDTGELAFSSSSATVHTGNINVPVGAVQGAALRMRVLSDLGGVNMPCENIEFGQTEDYSVLVVPAVASLPGEVPDTSLGVGKTAGQSDHLDFVWSASCGTGTLDYSVHEGSLGTWYSHTSVACTTAGATTLSGYSPPRGARYYLVVPIADNQEGSYGTDSGDLARPVSSGVCETTQNLGACP